MSQNDVGDILIVDDKPENLRLLSQILSQRGHNVRAVTSGARALESASTIPPDLILLDIRMPEMDGFEVCKVLKENRKTQDVPVIFISALNEIQDKVQAFNVGGVDYITKPFQLEEVLIRTETHLHLRQLQSQLQRANNKMQQELDMAFMMQDNFLPHDLPKLSGWEISANLRPARVTSGDFYDVFPLPGGCYGILMADVVDKGVAAALFMVLAWSLIRTYAREFPNNPADVCSAVNSRILEDTEEQQYVTVFYGILNPSTGNFTFANAGHVPAILLPSSGETCNQLPPTGIPLGLFEDASWQNEITQIVPGTYLILYTDGVLDAQNPENQFFKEARLLQAVQKRVGLPAKKLHEGLLEEIVDFMGDANQYDDIAVITIYRNPSN